jgi:hypothetical protein
MRRSRRRRARSRTDRIDVEEVLVVKSKPDHPGGELDRIGTPGVTRPGVQRQQLAGQIADQPGGVIRMLDHLHHVTDGSLHQLDQRAGRRRAYGYLQFHDDGPGRACPLHAFAVVEEPSRAKTAVDLGAQLPEIACCTSGDEAYRPRDIDVKVNRRGHNLSQLLRAQGRDQLTERRL